MLKSAATIGHPARKTRAVHSNRYPPMSNTGSHRYCRTIPTQLPPATNCSGFRRTL